MARDPVLLEVVNPLLGLKVNVRLHVPPLAAMVGQVPVVVKFDPEVV